MKIVDLKQGSPEWIKWRLTHVTATDSSCILGINPWKTAFELWQEKLGMIDPKPANERMKRGSELEPIARALFIEETGIEVTPIVIEHDHLWWHGSSLDGIDATGNIIVEIKCPSADTHLFAVDGNIQPYYISQIQHQFYTSGAEICYYVSYNPECDPKLKILEINPDTDYMEIMVEKERKFYEVNLCSMQPPDDAWELKKQRN